MDTCFFIQHKPGKSRIIVRRNAAIGDSICASVVADRLIAQGHEVIWQTHAAIQGVMRRHPRLFSVTQTGGHCDVNLDDAYEKDPNRASRHFHEMFFEVAGRQLLPLGIQLGPPTNCRPALAISGSAKAAVRSVLASHPRPWVFICPRSNFYSTRTIADGVWQTAAAGMPGTKFWLGTHSPAPPGIVDLRVGSIEYVMDCLSVADLLVTVDTGPMHIAAAVGTPIVAIEQSSSPRLHLTDQNDYSTVGQSLTCLNCQQFKCPVSEWKPPCQYPDANAIAAAVAARLAGAGRVSCLIPTYDAKQRLARCINAVLPQVDEVVVSRAADGKLPPNPPQDPKIRYVQSPHSNIGFGRNVNFGMRHTTGEFVLLLNDDCYLDPNAVAHLRAEMKDGVGIVGHLLRYPSGRICHGGKHRKPGMRGWGLTDNRQYHPTISEPTQMENVTGTSVLIRRKAFYDAGAFDEDFFLYAEDDAFCLQLGQCGWRIMYTPHATGIHEEAATTQTLSRNIMTSYVYPSNAVFERKWGWWIEKNLNTIPGTF